MSKLNLNLSLLTIVQRSIILSNLTLNKQIWHHYVTYMAEMMLKFDVENVRKAKWHTMSIYVTKSKYKRGKPPTNVILTYLVQSCFCCHN